MLLSHQSFRRQMVGLFPGDKAEHPYSWLDDTSPTALSSDGRFISFFESGEIYYLESDDLAYYRATDGAPAVRLGAGYDTISPDGKSVLWRSLKSRKLTLQPLGAGEPRDLSPPDLVDFRFEAWSDNGRDIVYEAQSTGQEWGVYTQNLAGGSPRVVKNKSRNNYPIISPDGGAVALREEQGGISLYAADGSSTPTAVKGVDAKEFPLRFAKGGKAILVVKFETGRKATLTLVDLASGRRELWKDITTQYHSGQGRLLTATPDLRYYAYNSSVLFLGFVFGGECAVGSQERK